MAYPFGSQAVTSTSDLPYTLIQRRQGDVKATLIPITMNGVPVNIQGFTFHFSVNLPAGVSDTIWTAQGPASGTPITTVGGSGFAIPGPGFSVSAPFLSTTLFVAGGQIYVTAAGIMTVVSVDSSTSATILNSGLSGNATSGTVLFGTNVFAMPQVGMTVLIIPQTVTLSPVGIYPFYLKYDTADPMPGPYRITFMQGGLQIMTHNNPNA